MPATKVLEHEMTFNNVPLKGTKRGFAIPSPAVLRTMAVTGREHPKDKEWDGRPASFTWKPQTYYTGTMNYKPVGIPGYTKTIVSVTEVDKPTWFQAMRDWTMYLHDNAEDWTNTSSTVIAAAKRINPKLIARSSMSVGAVAAPSVPTPVVVAPVPTPMPVNGALTMPSWDPNDLDIAHDLFDVPADNRAFLPDKETFQMMDITWTEAISSGEPKHMLIYGDTSTGKTEHPKIWCARNDVLWCRIDCGAFGEIYDVTGPIKASVVTDANGNANSITEWVKGKTIRAMADPRPAVIQLDEVNRISDVKAMNVLFPFFDSSKQSYFDDNQTWMKLNGVKLIICTMNGDTRGDDIGEYVGTQPLDQAFISRFPIRRQLRYPNAEKLAQILEARNAGAIKPEQITMLSEIAVELVALNKFVPNLRELFAALDFLKAGIDIFHALKWTVGGIYKDDGTVACDYTQFKAVLIGKGINVDES